MKNSILLILTILLLSACSSSDNRQLITVEDKYSISLPTFLKETDILHDEAAFQYQNQLREFYIIIIDEPKEQMHEVLVENELEENYSKDLDGYTDLVWGKLGHTILVTEESEIIDTTINDMPAKLLTLTGNIENLSIFYYFVTVEGKNDYYQMVLWSLANRERIYKNEMERIINSFKEIYN